MPLPGGLVELTDEWERHIVNKHAELLPKRRDYIGGALTDPDLVLRRQSAHESILFCPWHYDMDKYAVVAVIADPGRNWIITAYITSPSTSYWKVNCVAIAFLLWAGAA